MLPDDFVDPFALVFQFVVAHIVHGLLQSDVSSSVGVFAVCLLADSFCHHRFLPEVVISL